MLPLLLLCVGLAPTVSQPNAFCLNPLSDILFKQLVDTLDTVLAPPSHLDLETVEG